MSFIKYERRGPVVGGGGIPQVLSKVNMKNIFFKEKKLLNHNNFKRKLKRLKKHFLLIHYQL